jgi:hypothetical protein
MAFFVQHNDSMRRVMSNLLLGLGVAAVCSTGALAADDRVPVTISGCVNSGTDSGTFVLTNVEELSAGRMTPTSVIYWLSTTKGLKERVGQTIEVTGTYSPSRDAGKTGKQIIESDPASGEAKVAVENGSKKAELKTPTAVGTTGVKTELTKPYRALDVQTIRMIVSSCR